MTSPRPLLAAAASVVCASLVACASAPPPPPPPAPTPAPAAPAPPAPPEKVAVQTGKDCAKAEAECADGLCTISVKNDCDQPVSCDVGVSAVCKTDAEMVDAEGRGRGTIPAKSSGKLSAVADCTKGRVMTTRMKDMRCR